MLGKFLGKLITVPIRIIADVVESGDEDLAEAVTESIEKQVKDIIE